MRFLLFVLVFPEVTLTGCVRSARARSLLWSTFVATCAAMVFRPQSGSSPGVSGCGKGNRFLRCSPVCVRKGEGGRLAIQTVNWGRTCFTGARGGGAYTKCEPYDRETTTGCYITQAKTRRDRHIQEDVWVWKTSETMSDTFEDRAEEESNIVQFMLGNTFPICSTCSTQATSHNLLVYHNFCISALVGRMHFKYLLCFDILCVDDLFKWFAWLRNHSHTGSLSTKLHLRLHTTLLVTYCYYHMNDTVGHILIYCW